MDRGDELRTIQLQAEIALYDRVEVLQTALRRIVSLEDKNVLKYAQRIAREALNRQNHIMRPTQMDQPLPCIVCKKPLRSVHSGFANHADDANSFRAHGQYGSTVFDPVDGTYLEVNICDGCIIAAADAGRVLTGRSGLRDDLVPWKPKHL